MECFTHSGSSAIAVCKVCGKAVCHACAVDAGVAIACSEVCGQEATALHEMNQRGKKIYGIGIAKPKVVSGVIAWLLLAALFGGTGTYGAFGNKQGAWFLLAFAGISIVIAIIAHRRAKDIGLQC